MKTTKRSAFLSGIVVGVTGILVENKSVPVGLFLLVFFSSVLVFVIGFEIFRQRIRGEHVSFMMGAPRDSEGLRMYDRILFRMLSFSFGAVLGSMATMAWLSI